MAGLGKETSIFKNHEMRLKGAAMRRSKWMTFFVIASFFIAVPGYWLKLKIATLSPEGSVWMDKMQAGADEIHRKTNNRVAFKFFGGGIMGNSEIYSAALPFMIVLLVALLVITYVPGLTLLFRS